MDKTTGKEYPHADLTGRIIKACQAVHRYYGPGLPEIIYHRATHIELGLSGMESRFEPDVLVHYRDGSFVGKFIPDLIVESLVIVEIKALSELTDDHIAQALTYLKATNLQVALLVNFGEKSLVVRRLINAHYDPNRPPNVGQSVTVS